MVAELMQGHGAEDPAVVVTAGRVAADAGRYTDATTAYQQALGREPEYARALPSTGGQAKP